jgi:hypothetical protein
MPYHDTNIRSGAWGGRRRGPVLQRALQDRLVEVMPATGEIELVLLADPIDVPDEIRLRRRGEHRDAIPLALPVADDDLIRVQIDVLHAEPAALEQPEARAVQQQRHQTRHAIEPLQDGANLGARQHDRKPLRALGSHHSSSHGSSTPSTSR